MIYLRTATIDDAEMLEYWDTLPHVLDSDPDDEWHWREELMREPAWRQQLIAELDGKPIGMVQIIDPAEEETAYQGAIEKGYRAIDIWIGESDMLGKGYGTLMMEEALKRCFAAREVHTVLIDPLKSNVRAIKFYQKMGFVHLEDRYFDKQLCCVHVLSRTAWDNRNKR